MAEAMETALVGAHAKRENVQVIYPRYRQARRREKGVIPTETGRANYAGHAW